MAALLCLAPFAPAALAAYPAGAQVPGVAAHAVTESAGTVGSGQVADPSVSLAEPAAMVSACASGVQSSCNAASLAAIDRARAAESLRPLQLPAGYSQLPVNAQILVVTDLERTDRGLPGFSGLSAELDRLASAGAAHRTDPAGPSGAAWGSNFAIGYSGALQADYAWMYDDGPGSNNSDCRAGATSLCWGHRHNILGSYGPHPAMGAAVVPLASGPHKGLILTQLFAACPAGALDMKLPPNA